MKAGLLHHMYKGRGDRSSCQAHRGILLLSSLGKCLHRTLRPRLAEHFDSVAAPSHLIGRAGETTAFAVHIVRTYIRDRVLRHVSGAIVFADIAAAYYSAVRELASTAVAEEEFADICRHIPISDGDKLELRRHLQSTPAMQAACAGDWLCNVTTELNSSTWMGLANDHGPPILTKRGTRPGSAFADITFGVMLKRILDFREQLRPVELTGGRPVFAWGVRSFRPDPVVRAKCDATTHCKEELGDVVWADDLAACLQCEGADDIGAAVGVEAGCMADAFAQHGLVLAYGPQKTAAVCVVRGPGSRAARRRLFGQCSLQASCELTVLRECCEPDKLPLVPYYKHLGVWQTADGSIRRELSHRIGQAWASFRAARRKVFKCKQVGVTRKAAFLKGIVFAKLLVGAGTWPPLREGEARMFQACVINMVRQVLCLPKHGEHDLHFCSLFARAGLCSPTVMLHKERLCYAVQLLRHGPPVLWAALKQDEPFCELMLSAFEWLFCRVEGTCPLRSPREDWAGWATFICKSPAKFKGWVKRACGLQ